MMDLITADRRALADALSELTAEQWRGQSLCAGWTPAHVLAHLTMPFRISVPDFMAGLQRHGGDFTKFSDEIADRDSAIPPSDLVAVLRDNAENPWEPPGGGQTGALTHDVIHGLDMTWPLSIEYKIPDQALTVVLDALAGHGDESLFGVSLNGIRISATDLDWSAGAGAQLAGRSRDLIPMLAGRRIPLEVFTGDGVSVLALFAGSR
jgi:uncharacterized protein (TIGR03083 family)